MLAYEANIKFQQGLFLLEALGKKSVTCLF